MYTKRLTIEVITQRTGVSSRQNDQRLDMPWTTGDEAHVPVVPSPSPVERCAAAVTAQSAPRSGRLQLLARSCLLATAE